MNPAEAGNGPYWAYVLQSAATAKRYVGQTDNLSERIAQHNSVEHNTAKFTSKHEGPWLLVYAESQPTRADAMRREKWLKSGAGREWFQRHLIERSAAAD